ncbi:hypothetical protein AB0M80_32185 [Amycolatopsis sp. NPDC051045]|uniref:hypothetical protein n=1 Tax=Amycolatopsis sp. NPDC051045 TaxID=3156922 RepID=UPI0034209721
MTTDAARPRQRSSADPLPADPGAARVVLDLAEMRFRDAGCLPVPPARRVDAPGGRLAVVSAVTRPIALLGLGDLMPVRPAREAVEASRVVP